MNRLVLLIALAPLGLAAPAFAQQHEHPSPAAPAAASPADPHAGHTMPAARPEESAEPPPVPADHAADAVWGREDMAAARRVLRAEHGDIRYAKFSLETGELRPSSDGEGYGWEGQVSYSGDINRFVLKSEGEGRSGDLQEAELQGLYARAIGRYFNLEVGLRHDFEPEPTRTYGVLGVHGLAPYWFEVGAAGFLSGEGDITARIEASYDLRLTQKLILEPNAEVNLAAQDVRELGLGSGVTDAELGLRLRYAIRPELAPYIGVLHQEKFGDTADFARTEGEGASDTRMVVGLRAWF